MIAGEVCLDLVLLRLVEHASRFVPREGERPETCWLEQWTRQAARRRPMNSWRDRFASGASCRRPPQWNHPCLGE